jgi:O-antigen/teichoic acid export membrane protein
MSLAKLGTPELVGQYALALAITGPIFLFTNLGLRPAQATDAKRDYAFPDYFGLRIVATLAALVATVVATLLGGYPLWVGLVIVAVGCRKAVESISDVIEGALQQHERLDLNARADMAKSVLVILGFGGGLLITASLPVAIALGTCAYAIVVLTYELPNARRVTLGDSTDASPDGRVSVLWPSFAFSTLLRLGCTTLPLGITMLLLSLNTNIPRYFIEGCLGTRELGLFAAVAYVLVAGNMVISALGQSASPRLARNFAAGNNAAYCRLLLRLLGMGLLLGALAYGAAVVAGPLVLTMLYTPEYAQYSNILCYIAALSGFTYVNSFLGYGMTAARQFRIQPYLALLSAGSCAIAAACCVRPLGLSGAVVALATSTAVQIAGGVVVVGRAVARNRPAAAQP